ncbi:hypothetical protein DICVIV_02520 [Dictyocaulus viviparus]|uniref:Uncharacterized protein n=1 Tax=Dictyocaulus viviparus TaxID=29172 RepID=A0A0D8Y558_DICVI|nr:hypothetical protein DICVIV_02520 [Dictyocaulus viviparus]
MLRLSVVYFFFFSSSVFCIQCHTKRYYNLTEVVNNNDTELMDGTLCVSRLHFDFTAQFVVMYDFYGIYDYEIKRIDLNRFLKVQLAMIPYTKDGDELATALTNFIYSQLSSADKYHPQPRK